MNQSGPDDEHNDNNNNNDNNNDNIVDSLKSYPTYFNYNVYRHETVIQ